jgi:hypothetical protein
MNPWPVLSQFPGPSALAAVWRKYLAEAYEPFQANFLEPKSAPARTIPCPRGCGCHHEVVPFSPRLLPPGMREPALSPNSASALHPPSSIFHPPPFLALCRCDPPRCRPIPVTTEDVVPLKLSWTRLARALCHALRLDPKPDSLNLPTTHQIGSWSADAVPAILTIHYDSREFRADVADLLAQLPRPFILLAPTTAHLEAHTQGLLARVRAAFFSLETIVELTPEGALRALQRPGDLFAPFAPTAQPVAEDIARRLFVLAKALDSEPTLRKASPSTVLRLYCVEALEPDQIARKLGCARSLIYSRLQLLARKLGRHPAELRQYSSHFQAIEDSLSDPRARHIHRLDEF